MTADHAVIPLLAGAECGVDVLEAGNRKKSARVPLPGVMENTQAAWRSQGHTPEGRTEA